jgi:hypothetical protein
MLWTEFQWSGEIPVKESWKYDDLLVAYGSENDVVRW